ncbi:Wzz/FepE/Etk N-terminal domain-containing protein [Pseudoalteromonas sp. SR43-3]|uniref:Wzz/FepE/Etk N-terminal domain-containing protein n=1 Tax=Pseudoalteromonas sp. SR43-3 TaxID=2760943 RepID=UPI001601474A|nr:Wzz/FepE/Etk N-terminal domain-containing protein [Pseudoalteromonas sp. SR43-3]MBB1275927.1 LPS O-antigen length regulator [Pseudoalteromonas sp. SR43-3]
MERSVDSQNIQQSMYAEDEGVDLKGFFLTIWKGKLIIAIVTVIFTCLSIALALSLPNIYKAEALLFPADSGQGEGGLAALTGQFGGLASMAGIDLGAGSSDKSALAIEVLKSRKFTSEFIESHNILLDLMAAKDWSYEANIISYDDDIYDAQKNTWVRDVEPPFKPKPSLQEAYKEFKEIVYINSSKDTGMVTISVEHISPYIAQQWVVWLIEDINKDMKERDVAEAVKSTEFLKQQIESTKVADIKTVLFKLIEEQAKTIMFAEVRDEYVFKTIDPALVPEERVSPKRALICVVGGLFGILIGILIVLGKNYFREQESAW